MGRNLSDRDWLTRRWVRRSLPLGESALAVLVGELISYAVDGVPQPIPQGLVRARERTVFVGYTLSMIFVVGRRPLLRGDLAGLVAAVSVATDVLGLGVYELTPGSDDGKPVGFRTVTLKIKTSNQLLPEFVGNLTEQASARLEAWPEPFRIEMAALVAEVANSSLPFD